MSQAGGTRTNGARKQNWSFLSGIPEEAQLVATFDYTDANGDVTYQVCSWGRASTSPRATRSPSATGAPTRASRGGLGLEREGGCNTDSG